MEEQASEGLSEDVLTAIEAVLPDDAPPGHEAHGKVRFQAAHKWPMAQFTFNSANGDRIPFQATLGHCQTPEITQRVARACYVMFEGGSAIEEVKAFRQGVYKAIQEAKNGGKNGGPVDTGKKRPSRKTNSNAVAQAQTNGSASAPAPAEAPAESEASAENGQAPPASSPPAEKEPAPADKEPRAMSANQGSPADECVREAPALSEDTQDVPKEHKVWEVPLRKDNCNNTIWCFCPPGPDGKQKKFSVNIARANSNEEDAKRIARLCMAQILDGVARADVEQFRESLLLPHLQRPRKEGIVSSEGSKPVPVKKEEVKKEVKKEEVKKEVKQEPAEAEPTERKIDTEDAPPDSIAHSKVKFDKKSKAARFRIRHEDGTDMSFQATVKACNGSLDDAMRIARVLCHKGLHEGLSKEALEVYRDEMFRRIGGGNSHGGGSKAAGAGGSSKKRRRDGERFKESALIEQLRQQGKLTGAMRLHGRDPAKKNATVNGIYAKVDGGYAGVPAWQKIGEEKNKRCAFFAKEKSRWKISEELGDEKHFAFLKVKDGGKALPWELAPPDFAWKFFDGKEEGWKEDTQVLCSQVEDESAPSAKRVKSEGSEVKKEQEEESSSDSGSGSDSEASDNSSGGSSGSSSPQAAGSSKATASGAAAPSGPGPDGILFPNRKAAAKMLVRSGLRCSCHFSHLRDCPDRRSAVGNTPAT